MRSEALEPVLREFWERTRAEKVPPLPGHPVDAVAAVLQGPPHAIGDFTLGGVHAEDPWVDMALGLHEDPTRSEVEWALGAADLTPIGVTPDEGWVVLDRQPDPSGAHRVLSITPDGEVVAPCFNDIPALFAWAHQGLDVIDLERTPHEFDELTAAHLPPDGDPWHRSAASGAGALRRLLPLAPSQFYRAWRVKRWPETEAEVSLPKGADSPRVALLRVLTEFQRTRAVARDLDASKLSPAQKVTLDRLAEFERAFKADEAPEYITWLALDDNPRVASMASQWLVSFDHVHDAAAKDDTDEADAEVFRALYAGIEKALKELDRQGHIEINANARQDLTEEIVTVMTAARPLERAIRAAVETLVESPHVAEVYGDDKVLAHAIRMALGA